MRASSVLTTCLSSRLRDRHGDLQGRPAKLRIKQALPAEYAGNRVGFDDFLGRQ